MKNVIFLVAFFCAPVFYAQHSLPIQMDTSVINGEFVAYGVLDYSSTSIQNAMSQKLIYGGYIDEETKKASFDKHRIHNKLGVELNSEIEYRNFNLGNFLKGNYGFYVRGGYGAYASASYTDDLFGLTFYGNQRYMGDTANFSGSEMNMVAFQKIGFGFISKKLKSSLGLNYYNISNYGEAFIRNGRLVSDSSGANIELALDARLQYASGAQFNKGWGVGLDGDFRFQADWIKDRVAYFQAQFKNIGLMQINSVSQYLVDSVYNYDGLKFSQLIGGNSLSFSNQEDVLDSLGVSKSERKITTFLPGFVQIGKIVDEHSTQNLQSFFGVRLYTTLAYNPLIYGGIQYQAYSWMKIGLQAIYGGFSKFRVGFYTQYNYKNINLGIGSENLIGALSKKGNGESINLRIAVRW
jgi:hypothetical protein